MLVPIYFSSAASYLLVCNVFVCQVGKRLRHLTKHPHSGIQAVATDLFGYWKKVVLEETGKKNGSSENERSSDSSGKIEKARPVKIERNSSSSSMKVERSSDSSGKIEKARPVKIERNSSSASMKVEKRDVDVKGQRPDSVKIEKATSMVPKLNL